MAKKNISKTVDSHIKERTRKQQRIKDGDTLAVQAIPRQRRRTKPDPDPRPLQNYIYTCRYFEYQRHSRQHSGSLTFTANTLTYAHTDSGLGANCTYAELTGVWTDALPKTWTPEEWINHYLKVDDAYYKIIDNDADTLTIQTKSLRIPDEESDYDIVPFIPNQFVGSYLFPDNTAVNKMKIVSNTETVIEINIEEIEYGQVTVGDGSAPYNSFTSNIFADVMSNDHWNNYSIIFLDGTNVGEVQPITDFVSATGGFVTDNFTAAIVAGDRFAIRKDLLFASSGGTFEVQTHITPIEADFTSAPGLGNVIVKPYQSVNGEIFESNLPNYYNSVYSIELRAKKAGLLDAAIDCNDSIKIGLTPIIDNTLASQMIIHDSELQPNTKKTIKLPFEQGVWYRLDIYFYAESGVKGFRFTTVLGDLIDSWRDVTPPTPTDLTASGGISLINLGWKQDDRYKTQIWQSEDDATYYWLATVEKGINTYAHMGLNGGEQRFYKIRHITDRGDLSPFTSQVTGTTWGDNAGKGITVTGGNYPYLKEGDVINIKISLATELASEPLVSLYDSGGDTTFDANYLSTDGSDYFYDYTIPAGLDESDTFYLKIEATGVDAQTYEIDSDTFTIDYTPPTLTANQFLLDSDGVVTTLDENVTIRASNFIIARTNALYDALSGAGQLFAQPCLVSVATSVGTNFLTDTKLAAWGVVSLVGYALFDSNDDVFPITSFSAGTFNVTGNPSSGAYRIAKFDETEIDSWQYTFDYKDNDIFPALLDASMASSWLGIFDDTDIQYGFIITGDDLSGNLIETVSDMVTISLYYNPSANIPVKYEWYFWDGAQQVFANEQGWFNDTNLYLRIIADATPYLLQNLYYRRQSGGSWEAWQEVTLGAGLAQYTYDIDLGSNTGERIVQFYILNALGIEVNSQTVEYKYDNVVPEWTIADGDATGGFNRVGLSWSSNPTDTISGVRFINIYRATTNDFNAASIIGRTQTGTQQFFVDTMALDSAQTYYYWGKAQDFADNEQTTEQEIGSAKPVLLAPADVDGALRIQNNPIGANWNVSYGIRVPIEAVIITAGTLSNVGNVTAIQYKLEIGDSWTNVTNPKFNGKAVSYNHDISSLGEGETRTITFDPVQTGKYWRVVFDHADADTEITMVHFSSLLAADLIIGGVLRLEKGLSIWTGIFNGDGVPTDAGVYMDTIGLQMWDTNGNINLQLNSDGTASLGRAGLGQITIDAAGVITISSSLLTINSSVVFAPGYDPDKMRQVFTGSAPTTPYYVDDVWLDGDDMWVCTTQKLTGAYNPAHWVLATDYTNDDTADQALSDAADALAAADGKIVTYFQEDPPTDPPETLGEGDLWFDTNDGNMVYRWNDTTHVWIDAQDDEIAQAIADASTAQSTADGKVKTWYQGTAPTGLGAIDVGDLWVDTSDENKLHRWSGSSWVDIRDTGIAQALSDAANAQSTADGKIVSWWQNTPPAGLGASDVGDIWFDTNDNNRPWRWSGSAWVDAQDDDIAEAIAAAADAQSTADGKITTFYSASQPTPEGVGDLWVETDEGNRLWRYNGSIWQLCTDTTFDQNFAFYSASAPTTRPNGSALLQGDMWYETDEGNRPWVYTGSVWQEAYTEISGDHIVTGKIESYDSYTYFDLTNNLMKVHKTIDRVVIGKMSTGVYGMKIYSAGGVLMMQIDDSTQKIKSADGQTYFDLGNNNLVVAGGSTTGTLIRTSVAGPRIELSTTGLTIWANGSDSEGEFRLRDYASGTVALEYQIWNDTYFYPGQKGVAMTGNNGMTFLGQQHVIHQVGYDAQFDLDHMTAALYKTDSASSTSMGGLDAGLASNYRQYGLIKISNNGRDIYYIIQPNRQGQILILTASTYGYSFDLHHGGGSPPVGYYPILTRNQGTNRYYRYRPAMLMFVDGGWLCLNSGNAV